MLRGDSRRSLAAMLVVLVSMPVMLAYCVANSPVDPLTQREFQSPAVTTTACHDRCVRLPLDRRVAAGPSAFVFKGLEGRRIRLDHYLLASNPHYAYRHDVPLAAARHGFRLGPRRFRLLTADAAGITLQPLRADASP